MSQHWDPLQHNEPCSNIFLLEQFIANSFLLLFLFPLPSFPPFPLLPLAVLCCLCGKKRAPALAKSDINSFLSGDVQQNLPLINICSVSEPQGYWLHFVFIVVCFLTLCCSLYIKILPPACLRPGAEWGWTGHSSLLTRVSHHPLPLKQESVCLSVNKKKLILQRRKKKIQECRPMSF